MIFITGDVHAGIDIQKLNSRNFPQNKNLSKSDYVIVTGDAGFIWDGSQEEKYWLKWLQKKNFTTLFVDGNHENFDSLNSFPIENWNGGKIHRINDSVIHLMRGQVYTISNLKLFVFGGAMSSDKEFRKEHISWWKEEMPSEEEYQEGLINLEKHKFKVDIVITHTCPSSTLKIINSLFEKDNEANKITDFLERVNKKLTYRHCISGIFIKIKNCWVIRLLCIKKF